MSIATTTIRVPVTTKKVFESAAKHRGVSMAHLLAEQAKQIQAEEWFRQEREASSAPLSADGLADLDLWNETDDDWD